jgi:hypothetical protein
VRELVTAARNGDVQAKRALVKLEAVNPTALETFVTKG